MKFINNFLNLFTYYITIELGSKNIRISKQSGEIIINEPSIAFVTQEHKIIAFGLDALKLKQDSTLNNFTIISTMVGGVIADFEMTKDMIEYYIKKLYKANRFFKLSINISIPQMTTEKENEELKNYLITNRNIKEVHFIENIIYAMKRIGNNIGNYIIVDIGAGLTEVGIVSKGKCLNSKSIKIAGDVLLLSIVKYIRNNFNVAINTSVAEDIKVQIGTAIKLDKMLKMEIEGYDIKENCIIAFGVTSEDIRIAIEQELNKLVSAIQEVIEYVSINLKINISYDEIKLIGGGSSLRQINQFIEEKIMIPVRIVDI
jgi:rod shape-determining protein MreB